MTYHVLPLWVFKGKPFRLYGVLHCRLTIRFWKPEQFIYKTVYLQI